MCPPFDSELDFVVPINGLREAAMLSGRSVTMLKCDVGNAGRHGSGFSDADFRFFGNCASALSEGDALVRNRDTGFYYLVLIERTDDEVAHIIEFLNGSTAGDDDGDRSVEVVLLRSLRPGSEHDEELAPDLKPTV